MVFVNTLNKYIVCGCFVLVHYSTFFLFKNICKKSVLTKIHNKTKTAALGVFVFVFWKGEGGNLDCLIAITFLK